MLYKKLYFFSSAFLLINMIRLQSVHSLISKQEVNEVAQWTSTTILNYTGVVDATQCKFKALVNIENIKPNLAFTNTQYTLTLE
jgi:hypothetical protein